MTFAVQLHHKKTIIYDGSSLLSLYAHMPLFFILLWPLITVVFFFFIVGRSTVLNHVDYSGFSSCSSAGKWIAQRVFFQFIEMQVSTQNEKQEKKSHFQSKHLQTKHQQYAVYFMTLKSLQLRSK